MAEETTGTEIQSKDSLTFDANVIEKIVAITCREVEGIISMKGNFFSTIQEGFGGTDITKGVSAEILNNESASINLSLIMEFGYSGPELFNQLRRQITRHILEMTGLEIDGINVRVVDIMSKEESEARRRKAAEEQTEAEFEE